MRKSHFFHMKNGGNIFFAYFVQQGFACYKAARCSNDAEELSIIFHMGEMAFRVQFTQ